MDLLYPTQLYNINGDKVGTLYSYWNATIELYGKDQIATTAAILIVPLCFTVLLVVLLIMYSTKCFQKCFGRCHCRRQQAVHTFMSAFNGYYKDGTEGTRDCRYFAAVDLVIRIIPPLIYATTQNAMFLSLTAFFVIHCTCNSGHIDGSNEALQKAICSVQYCGYSPNSPYCAVPNFHWLQLPVFGYRSC